MLYSPPHSTLITSSNTTTAAEGTTITASGSTNTKGSWSQIISSTTYDAYGITILLAGVQTTASTWVGMLVDIGIGSSSAEQVLIPNLNAGSVAGLAIASGSGGAMYHFPIYIPSGNRLSARCQSTVASRTCTAWITLHHGHPIGWYGTRVTAYGAVTASDSSGTSHTHGNGSYATATELSASTTNPIHYMQIGQDNKADTGGTTKRGMFSIVEGATPNVIVEPLPWHESTTIEAVGYSEANFILSNMRFNIPSGISLRVRSMANAAGEARGIIVYGVD